MHEGDERVGTRSRVDLPREALGPAIFDREWARTNTVHKHRCLLSRRWEKKSSRVQLKTPVAQGEKKLASDKKLPPSLWRTQGRGVQFS